MDEMKIWDKLKDTPREAKKTITGGKLNGFTDINPMWRLRRLTELFGACGIGWKYEVTERHTIDGANGERMCFVEILLYFKDGDTWSAPIPGYGGSMLIDKTKNGLQCNDDGFKMALSDAIGTACKALGMSEDIYMSGAANSGSKYSRPQQPAQETPKTPAEAASMVINFGKYSGMTIREIYSKDRKYLEWVAENGKDAATVNAVKLVMEAANANRAG